MHGLIKIVKREAGVTMWNRIKPLKNSLKQELNLPEISKEVLIWDNLKKEVSFNCLRDDNKFYYYTYTCGEIDDEFAYEPGIITHWQELPSEPYNHIEGQCTDKECVDYCPSLEI